MQNGDLAEIRSESLIIVLEGVLALVVDEKAWTGRLWRKREETVSYSIIWHEVPLKRLVAIRNMYPNYALDVVTFRSEHLRDLAAEFLEYARIPVSEVRYEAFDDFCSVLKYQPHVRAVYDSEPERLNRYGQAGVAVVRGEDF